MKPLLAMLFFVLTLITPAQAKRLPTDHIRFETVGHAPHQKVIEHALDLIPNGFLHQGKPHVWYFEEPVDSTDWQAVSDLWSILPDRYRPIANGWVLSSYIAGITFLDESKVFIRNIDGPKDIQQTTIHEAAHCIWHDRMTKEQQDAYSAVWSVEKSQRNLVSRYAGTNSAEGFAESLSYWVVDPIHFSAVHPQTSDYFHALLKNLT